MEQLPAIWTRLVDAGFESGHAYGKALRTVKSCVGSTWCRYGVQDSVQLAIDLENRYRGLRSPHKLKGGVSGCARECAEARGKDFGVIATEKGWNLYVGGNGGANPAHAQLLAGDLDTETLVRYLDRFLMYYIRTADRLQRTATWMDALDGGLDRVTRGRRRRRARSRRRARGRRWPGTSGRYFDEWKATLEDPEKLAGSSRSSTRPAPPTRTSRSPPSAARSSPPSTTSPVRSRQHHPGRSAMTVQTEEWQPGLPVAELEVERGATALVHGQAVAIFRTHDDKVFALGNYDPFAKASCSPAGSSAPAATSRSSPRPMHKHAFDLRTGQCLDDRGRADVPMYAREGRRGRRARWVSATTAAATDASTAADGPAAPATGSGSPLPARSRSRRRCWSGVAPRVEWAPALSVEPNQINEVALRAATARSSPSRSTCSSPRPASGSSPGSRPPSRGVCSRPLRRHARWRRDPGAGPKSVGALRRSGLRELWSPESECFEDVLAHLRGRGLTGTRIVVQEHGQSLSVVAHALRRQGADVRVVTVYRVEGALDPAPMFRMVDLIAERKLDAVTFTSAPAVAALMDARCRGRAPRGGHRGLPGRRGRHLRRPGDGGGVRAVGRPDASSPTGRGWRPWSSCSRPSCPSAATVRRSRLSGQPCCSTATIVLLDGVEVPLSPAPLAVLQALAVNPGHVVSRRDLLASLPSARRDPSTPWRWPWPDCGPPSGPGWCRPSSSADLPAGRLTHAEPTRPTSDIPTASTASLRRPRRPRRSCRRPGRGPRGAPDEAEDLVVGLVDPVAAVGDAVLSLGL